MDKATYSKIKDIAESDPDDIITNINNQDQGTLKFNEIEDEINQIQEIFSQIDESAIKLLPGFIQQELTEYINPIINAIKQIQNSGRDPSKPDRNQKVVIIGFFKNEIFKGKLKKIWEIAIESTTLQNSKTIYTESSDYIKNIKSDKLTSDEIVTKLQSILSTAQTELSKGGIEKHSKIFDKQASLHEDLAKKWLKYGKRLVIGAISFATIILLILILLVKDNVMKLQLGIFSGIVLSFLSFGIVICFKNYFAEKHNQQINTHKGNCLSTFHTFIDAADEERKAVLLLQASQTIFSHQKSGYLSKEAESQSPNPIIGVLKNITQGNVPG